MMGQMMKECCGADGKPDFEKMKGFMEKCGKGNFSEDEIRMLHEFCGRKDQPDAEEMKHFMAKCGC